MSVLIVPMCFGGLRNVSCVNSELKRDSLFVFLDKTDSTIQKNHNSDGSISSFSLFYKDLIAKRKRQLQKQDSIDKAEDFENWWNPLPSPSIDFGVIESDTVKNISKYKFIRKDSLRKYLNSFNKFYFIEENTKSDYIIHECFLLYIE